MLIAGNRESSNKHTGIWKNGDSYHTKYALNFHLLINKYLP